MLEKEIIEKIVYYSAAVLACVPLTVIYLLTANQVVLYTLIGLVCTVFGVRIALNEIPHWLDDLQQLKFNRAGGEQTVIEEISENKLAQIVGDFLKPLVDELANDKEETVAKQAQDKGYELVEEKKLTGDELKEPLSFLFGKKD